MRRLLASAILLAVAGIVWARLDTESSAQEKKGKSAMVVHDVYFSLKDSSAEARKKLVKACQKYLTKHEGEVFFAAGILAEELNRPVNDRDFDVGLHIVFRDMKSHDKYQDHPRHNKFIEENKDNWKKVRVFDTSAQ
jgi:hypothetical protein